MGKPLDILDGVEGLLRLARRGVPALPQLADAVTRDALTQVGEGADLTDALQNAAMGHAAEFLVANEESITKVVKAYKALK